MPTVLILMHPYFDWHMKNLKFLRSNIQRQQQHGITMIEVLIAIIVMTFGLLGISGLMVKGINNSTGTDFTSRATQSAMDMMDAMRANRTAALAEPSPYITINYVTAADITGTTIADLDKKQWLTNLATLPGNGGRIERNGTIYTITVRFSNCIGTLNAADTQTCVNGTNPQYITISSQI
jgi:type IV pilus assembly protein PilV